MRGANPAAIMAMMGANRVICCVCAGLLLALGYGCDEQPVRSYQAPKSSASDAGGPPAMPAPGAGPASAGTDSGIAAYELPTGWREVPDPSGMRAVSLAAGEGDAAVTITAMSLPAGRFDLASNVQRWAGANQAEMDNPTPAQLAEAVSPIDAPAAGSSLVVLAGPERGVTAVVTPRGEAIWFFKMIGPAEQVAAQRQAFEQFVRSIRFAGDAPQTTP